VGIADPGFVRGVETDMTEVQYIACSVHPEVLLPVATIPGEAHLCAKCAQEARKITYEKQKAENT
jgi:hypothetical protein